MKNNYDKRTIMTDAHVKYQSNLYSSFGEALAHAWVEAKLDKEFEAQYQDYLVKKEERIYLYYE